MYNILKQNDLHNDKAASTTKTTTYEKEDIII